MKNKHFSYHRTSTDAELMQILELQQKNLKSSLLDDEKNREGFVTIQHSLEVLKKMQDACAHCVAKVDGKVIGYALSMVREFRNDIPILTPMFMEIDSTLLERHIKLNYIVMGQICVDMDFRGRGVFRGLYQFMAQELKPSYDAIFTEVDTINVRSSEAHKAVGFELFKHHSSNQQDWELILLKLN